MKLAWEERQQAETVRELRRALYRAFPRSLPEPSRYCIIPEKSVEIVLHRS